MQIDTSKSKVNFTIKKLLFLTVNGVIPDVKGEVKFNENSLTDSKIDLVITVTGIDTKNKKRNAHLLQKDFFNVKEYPTIKFSSSSIDKKNNLFLAKGELTLVGVTKTVEIPFQFKNNRATGEFSLNRLDYKLGNIPPFVASKNVDISFDCSIK